MSKYILADTATELGWKSLEETKAELINLTFKKHEVAARHTTLNKGPLMLLIFLLENSDDNGIK